MTDRLRADGRPVELFQGRWQPTADLDLLDLCLAAGVPVAEPDDEDTGRGQGRSHGFSLGQWLADDAPGQRISPPSPDTRASATSCDGTSAASATGAATG